MLHELIGAEEVVTCWTFTKAVATANDTRMRGMRKRR